MCYSVTAHILYKVFYSFVVSISASAVLLLHLCLFYLFLFLAASMPPKRPKPTVHRPPASRLAHCLSHVHRPPTVPSCSANALNFALTTPDYTTREGRFYTTAPVASTFLLYGQYVLLCQFNLPPNFLPLNSL